MATYQKKTLRTLSPLAREIAEAINECDAVKRRLKRLMGVVFEVELDAQALRSRFPDVAYNANKAHRERGRKNHNRGSQTLAELDADFHDPQPLEARLLGKFDNANP